MSCSLEQRRIWITPKHPRLSVRRQCQLLGLCQRRHVIAEGLFFVKADVARICAYKSFIENSARKLFELLLFQGAEQAGPDLRGQSDVIERNTPLFPLFL